MRLPPKWSHEDCVKYESAREIVTSLMAFRSKWIGAEQRRSSPHAGRIAQWREERRQYVRELRGLDVGDRARVDRIRVEYGAEVKRLMELGTAPLP